MHNHFTNLHDEDSHGESCSKHREKALLIAFIINLAFSIIEFAGGIYANSIAVVSDAVHDLGDSLAIAFALYVTKIANRGRDKLYSYGYRRFTILGAIVNSIILLTGSLIIIYTSVPRLITPEKVIPEIMVILSVFGIIFNYFAFRAVHKGNNLNDRTISLHLIEDIAGWAAVFVGSIIIYYTDLYIVDPILSILIALYIGYNVIKNLKEALSITMQSTPEKVNVEDIRQKINSLENISKAHHIHVWSLDGNYNIMTIHVEVSNKLSDSKLEGLKNEIRKTLKDNGIDHSTIELEFS